MSNNDHEGMKKLQVWVSVETWEELNSLGYTSPTDAVTAGFKLLLETPAKTPEYPQELPELRAKVELLQRVLDERERVIEEKDRRINDLNRFSYYFENKEVKVIELQGQQETAGEAQTESTREAPRKTRTTQEKSGEKALIRKKCKHCGEEFDTDNPRREYCKDAHRQAYFKQNQELKK